MTVLRGRLRSLLLWGGLATSGGAAAYAIRGVEFGEFADALRGSDYRWLFPSLAVLAAAVFLRAVRWRYLFARRTRPPLRAVTSALLIGYLFNNILPARAGEAARVVALHQRTGTYRVEALMTAATERLFDVLALLALLFLSTPFLPEVTWLRRAALVAIVLVAALAVVIVLVTRFRERPVKFLLRPLSRVPGISAERVDRAAANVVQGLAALRYPRLALFSFGLTLVSWLVVALSFWLLIRGFALGLGFEAAILVTIAVNLALVVPSSPAAIGVFEAAAVVALRVFGVADADALSYAVVLHAVNLVPYLIVGYAALHLHTLTIRRRNREPIPGAGEHRRAAGVARLIV